MNEPFTVLWWIWKRERQLIKNFSCSLQIIYQSETSAKDKIYPNTNLLICPQTKHSNSGSTSCLMEVDGHWVPPAGERTEAQWKEGCLARISLLDSWTLFYSMLFFSSNSCWIYLTNILCYAPTLCSVLMDNEYKLNRKILEPSVLREISMGWFTFTIFFWLYCTTLFFSFL